MKELGLVLIMIQLRKLQMRFQFALAHGGAGKIDDIKKVVKESNASAVALGSMVVFQKEGMGVLVNFPEPSELEGILV